MKQIYTSAAEDTVVLGSMSMNRGFDDHGGKLMECVVFEGTALWK